MPRREGTAIGTFYEAENSINSSLHISHSDQERYLDAVNSVLPCNPTEKQSITAWQSGWLPVDENSNEQLNFIKSVRLRAVQINGRFSGLIEVRSVKFTTAPAVAQDVIKLIQSLAWAQVYAFDVIA